ncbi:quinol dehydrogenase ferredoxin subunit NapH [Sedimentimonas flavescens]|uniref:Quinol dehydrogenase ferredoxin subunit NapH n=1 Tax=Sedimentimonas flavescens TaxID=2851012 RepID=A0ABT2ZWF5_9RHOB|nr:quinol dehydrogenase ferredoxin subunit NapH [Sedimentimonas flavescens]MCT2538799.1 quinol dehydrogenase ferredoxin subunit NapH [Sedimentimonas flavescens]MCV2877839.1 quinol dehydrogenase ferredoxin subunit NapH [Sedimentimonas flavescens]
MSEKTKLPIGAEAIATKGWIGAHKWLLLRRLSQAFFLGLFLIGPWFGLWIVKGNLAGSLTLETLPLTDPLVLLQSIVARHWPEMTAIFGALIVLAVYALIGGRVYCSWVCPINPVTDGAYWLHNKLGVPKGWQPKKSTRYWLLAMLLIVSAATGTVAWEFVNPITMLQRGLVFGMGFGWTLVLGIFLFDLFVSRRGWCSHLCPVGAFYGLVGNKALLRVSATNRAACDDCMDCFAVCPEMHVITPALRGKTEDTPLILSPDCTNCGRCIDVCSVDVFRFTNRFDKAPAPGRDEAARKSPAQQTRAA